VHPNEDLLRREVEAAFSEEFYTDDHVLRFPGRGPLAGEYVGYAGLAEFGDKLGSRVTSLERNLLDVLANDERGVQIIDVHATRAGGAEHRWRMIWLIHIRDGRIAESSGHPDDLGALEAFFSGE